MIRRRPTSTLFPYTTLFRSIRAHGSKPSHAPVVGRRARNRRFVEIPQLRLLARRHAEIVGCGKWNRLGRSAAADFADSIFHTRSEEHTSELQSQSKLVCRLL